MDNKITNIEKYRKDRIDNPVLIEMQDELSNALVNAFNSCKLEKPDISEENKCIDSNKNSTIEKSELNTVADSVTSERVINKIISKLMFVGLLFLLIYVLIKYLFASNTMGDYSELSKQISLLMIGILAMIALVGYRWVGRNERK